MPPAIWAPAAIMGGAQIVGSIFGSRANNKATDAQMKANTEALKYTKEQDARQRREMEIAWDAYNARREMLMRRYGLEVPEASNPYSAPPAAPGAVPRGGPANIGMNRGENLGDLTGRRSREWEGGGNA